MDTHVLAIQKSFISCPTLKNINLENKSLTGGTCIEFSSADLYSFLLRLKTQSESLAQIQVDLLHKRTGIKLATAELITELLLARRYRLGKRSDALPVVIIEKIGKKIREKKPITLHISMFPCKIPNALKSAGPHPDLGEVITLLRLYEICYAISLVYDKGAIFTVYPDGRRFAKIANFPESWVSIYQADIFSIVAGLRIDKNIHFTDYLTEINKVSRKDRLVIQQTEKEYLSMYKNKCGYFHSNYEWEDILAHIDTCHISYLADPLFKKFYNLFESLLYTVYHPELMEENNDADTVVKVYQNILSPSKDAHIQEIRKSIIRRSWNAAVAYTANIHTIRDTHPIETLHPDSIRLDMHSIPGRIGLYTFHRSTKYTPFHTSCVVETDGECNLAYRINLCNENYVRWQGKVLNIVYDQQPFAYISSSLLKNFPDNYMENITIKK